MTLQTDNGTVNDMDGSMRELADWKAEMNNAKRTNLTNDANSKYVFYGLIQNKDEGTKTVGFNAKDSRTVNMTLTPKAGLEAGTYTVTVQAMQQNVNGNDKECGTPIAFTFTVEKAADKAVATSLESDDLIASDVTGADSNTSEEVVEPSGDVNPPAGGADTPDTSNTSADEAAGEGSTDAPAETPAE